MKFFVRTLEVNMEELKCDKMIIAIVQGEEYQDAIYNLNQKGFYVTILNSTGGFLKKKSVTLMIGVNKDKLDEAIDILKQHGERIIQTYQPMLYGTFPSSMSQRVIPCMEHCGGVILFVMDIEKSMRF